MEGEDLLYSLEAVELLYMLLRFEFHLDGIWKLFLKLVTYCCNITAGMEFLKNHFKILSA